MRGAAGLGPRLPCAGPCARRTCPPCPPRSGLSGVQRPSSGLGQEHGGCAWGVATAPEPLDSPSRHRWAGPGRVGRVRSRCLTGVWQRPPRQVLPSWSPLSDEETGPGPGALAGWPDGQAGAGAAALILKAGRGGSVRPSRGGRPWAVVLIHCASARCPLLLLPGGPSSCGHWPDPAMAPSPVETCDAPQPRMSLGKDAAEAQPALDAQVRQPVSPDAPRAACHPTPVALFWPVLGAPGAVDMCQLSMTQHGAPPGSWGCGSAQSHLLPRETVEAAGAWTCQHQTLLSSCEVLVPLRLPAASQGRSQRGSPAVPPL